MILHFTPIVKTLVWGTERWVLSGVPGSESVVEDGPLAGKTLTEVWGGEFPLLVKFIDARRDLSIQVHPNDALARARHGCNGKTEMWYVTGADPGARLLSGFSQQITPADYVRLVGEDRITQVLASHSVSEGDVFFLPAGRIHAIGGGVRLAEIQQSSDITYRIYDYGRPGLDGKPRELHTEQARDAIDYRVYPGYRSCYTPRPNVPVDLVRCPQFTTQLLDLTQPCELPVPACGWIILTCLSGSIGVDPSPSDLLSGVGLAPEGRAALGSEEGGPSQTVGRAKRAPSGTSPRKESVISEGEAVLVMQETEPLWLRPRTSQAKLLLSSL